MVTLDILYTSATEYITEASFFQEHYKIFTDKMLIQIKHKCAAKWGVIT